MKKAILTFILIFQFYNCSLIQSQIEKPNCKIFSNLSELKKELTPKVKEFKKELINKEVRFFCPNTSLFFNKNCEFPNDIEPIALNIAYLVSNKKKIKIITSSEPIEYSKNPEITLKRANTIKEIFILYGINHRRISILNFKDEKLTNNNDTEKGRKNNRNIKMIIEE